MLRIIGKQSVESVKSVLAKAIHCDFSLLEGHSHRPRSTTRPVTDCWVGHIALTLSLTLGIS